MSIIRGFLKIASGLVGAVLMLGGVVIFFGGIFWALKGRFGQSILFFIAGILISAISVFLGKFARGDFD